MLNDRLILSREERIEVYKEAAARYSAIYQGSLANVRTRLAKLGHKSRSIDLTCSGMCNYISNAACVRYGENAPSIYGENAKRDWPEYYSFKPKKTWKRNSDFWWTTRISRGGHLKRIEVLTQLAEGKSKEN